MNRGTALKWADALKKTSAKYNPEQLGFRANGIRHMSPTGILCEFLDPDGVEIAWDGVSMIWEGEQFALPESFQKCAKIKHGTYDILPDIECFKGVSLSEIEAGFTSHLEMSEFILKNYQVL